MFTIVEVVKKTLELFKKNKCDMEKTNLIMKMMRKKKRQFRMKMTRKKKLHLRMKMMRKKKRHHRMKIIGKIILIMTKMIMILNLKTKRLNT